MAELLLVEGLDRNQLENLVPAILIGLKDRLASGNQIGPDFNYQDIGRIFY